MKSRASKFARILGLALVFTIATGGTVANAKVCKVNVYKAYKRAITNGWDFLCDGDKTTMTFVPLQAEGKISCQGKTNAFYTGVARLTMHFFKKYSTTTKFDNGWKLHSYKISGGSFSKFSANQCMWRGTCLHTLQNNG